VTQLRIALRPDIAKIENLLFYPLGTSCLIGYGFTNPYITGAPDGFSIAF
jgi:hypothetical protein